MKNMLQVKHLVIFFAIIVLIIANFYFHDVMKSNPDKNFNQVMNKNGQLILVLVLDIVAGLFTIVMLLGYIFNNWDKKVFNN